MDRIHGVRRQQWDFAGETIDRPATVLDGLVQPQIAIQSCGSPETVMSLFETTQAADSGFGQRVPLHEGRVTQKRDHVRESTFEESHGLGECRAGPHFWANLQFGKPILCILLRLALVEQTPDALNEPANLGEQGLFLQERRQRFPLRGLRPGPPRTPSPPGTPRAPGRPGPPRTPSAPQTPCVPSRPGTPRAP